MSNKNNKKQQQGVRVKPIHPKTEGQQEYMRSIVENDITICTGPAGTGKSVCCIGIAAEKLVNGTYDKIILTRPVVGCGKKSLGALPGDIEEKMWPYLNPILSHLQSFIGEHTLKTYLGMGKIEISPMEFMRGTNFDNCFVILDEAQNADLDELVMFITRFSQNCKMVINGDPAQTDLPPGARGLDKIVRKCFDLPGFGVVQLTNSDIVRHDIVRRFLIAMESTMSRKDDYRLDQGE